MTDQKPSQKTGRKRGDESDVKVLIDHGRRKGYLTRSDIIDCIPEAEYDQELLEEALEEINQAGVRYFDDTDEEEQSVHPEIVEDPGDEGDMDLEVNPGVDDLKDVEVNDMVRLYVKEAARVPLLTAEEEVELAQRIEQCRMAQEELKRGHVGAQRVKELRQLIDEGRTARERLIRANARLVISVARKYLGRGLDFLDLIQEGNIGLMRAIRNYDYHRGFKFSTYATWWIRQAITRALAEQSRAIRLPVHVSDQVNRFLREQSQLHQRLGRAPSTDELAEALGVTPAKVNQMIEIVKKPLSLQAPVGEEDEEELGNVIEDAEAPDPEEATMQLMMNEDLMRRLETLPPRELQVIRLRYGLAGEPPLTLNEVGQRMSITRERARQLEAQALQRLRSPAGSS